MGDFSSTDILPEQSGLKRHLGRFAPTSVVPVDNSDGRTAIQADYKVVLSNHKGFEEVILEHASTRGEAYAAFQAWMVEYNADPVLKSYPPDTWAICTRNGELSWKTNPFI